MTDKRLEEISKIIGKVPLNSVKWADLILESSSILNKTTPDKIFKNIQNDLKKDLGQKAVDLSHIDGYIDGLDLCFQYVRDNYPLNLSFLHSYNLSKAVLIKHKAGLVN